MKFKIIALTIAFSLVFACSSDDSPATQLNEMEDPTDDTSGDDGPNDPEPTAFVVTGFSPTQAYTGETVIIIGDSIDLDTEYVVTFNNIESPNVIVTETQLEAVIPSGEASGIIRIQHDTFNVEVGTMDVIVENARIFGLDPSLNDYVVITPNSGLANGTRIKPRFSDQAGVSFSVEQIPFGQGFDTDFRFYSYRTGSDMVAPYGIPYSTIGSSSDGQLFGIFSYEDNNGVQINRLYKSTISNPFDYETLFDFPETYNVRPHPVFIEATQNLYHSTTVTGQSGSFVWKFNTDTLESELIPYSNTFSQLTRSPEDRLVTIDNVNNTIIVLDENTLESTEVLFTDIPQAYVNSPVMFSFSTDRIFLATNESIYIIDPVTNNRSETTIASPLSYVHGGVNL